MRTGVSARHRLGLMALLLVALIVLSGCQGSGDPMPSASSSGDSTSVTLQDLQGRPRFEESETRYLAMLDDMRAALSAISPGLAWKTAKSVVGQGSLCGKPGPDGYDAEEGTYDSGDARGHISDQDWPRAQQALASIATKYGFTGVTPAAGSATPEASASGRRILVIGGPWGSSVEYGQITDTTLIVFGPCLLREHPRPTST